MQSKGR